MLTLKAVDTSGSLKGSQFDKFVEENRLKLKNSMCSITELSALGLAADQGGINWHLSLEGRGSHGGISTLK